MSACPGKRGGMAHGMCCRAAALALLALLPGITRAAPVEAKQDRLKAVQERIESLRRDMSRAEKSKDYAADQLRETETAISDTNRRLHQLTAERAAVEGKLKALEDQTQRLGQQTSVQQNQLARLLNRQFIGGDADALTLLLAGRDPNLAARDRYFLTQLSRAKADLIQELRTAAGEQQRLADAAREQQTRLAEIERRQQESHAQLLARKKQRAATLARLADRIRTQRHEIATLRRDEQRLTNLIAGLAASARKKSLPPKVGAGNAPQKGARTAKSYDPGRVSGAFAALRGKLRLPVAGRIASYFGSTRAEGGATWKGLFIRAAEGEQIHAVAPGTIVYADWLRGFGNLLIIDHGDDFLSVYGNNESLLGAVGAPVTSGQAIATAGNSGGNPDSGLYFELRHRGQAFDPLKWIGSR